MSSAGSSCAAGAGDVVASEVRFGAGVGSFPLLCGVAQALAQLEQRAPRTALELHFDAAHPFNSDVILRLQHLGLKLHFLPRTQRLYLIDAYDVKRTTFRHGTHLFAGAAETSSLSVYDMCGPTFPGVFIEESGALASSSSGTRKGKQSKDDESPGTDARTYVLQYNGVAFFFPVPRQFQHLYEQNDKMPFEFPDGTTAPLERFCVFPSDANFLNIHDYPDEYDRFVTVRCHLPTSQCAIQVPDNDPIMMHMTPQQVIDALGTPQGEYHPEPKDAASEALYFYNYFALGIDVGFSAEYHRVDRIKLHTNIPGHPHFGRSARCPFVFHIDSLADGDVHALSGMDSGMLFSSKWTDCQAYLSQHLPKDSVSQPAAIKGGPSHAHPFGQSFLHGFPDLGCIFEVTSAGWLASLTLFPPASTHHSL